MAAMTLLFPKYNPTPIIVIKITIKRVYSGIPLLAEDVIGSVFVLAASVDSSSLLIFSVIALTIEGI